MSIEDVNVTDNDPIETANDEFNAIEPSIAVEDASTPSYSLRERVVVTERCRDCFES